MGEGKGEDGKEKHGKEGERRKINTSRSTSGTGE